MSPRVECPPRHFTLGQNAPRTFYTRAACPHSGWSVPLLLCKIFLSVEFVIKMAALSLGHAGENNIGVCIFQKDKEKAIAYHQCSFRLPLCSLADCCISSSK